MGLARYQAATLPHGRSKQASHVLNAFPSPSSDVSITSPLQSPSTVAAAACVEPSWQPRQVCVPSTALESEGVVGSQPLPATALSDMYSSLSDYSRRQPREAIHNAAQSSVRSLTARAPLRDGNDLRLPSFEALGIAAPHPDSRQSILDPSQPILARSPVGESSHVLHPPLTPNFDPSHPLGDFGALTPPADSGDPQWKPVPTYNAPLQSHMATGGQPESQPSSMMEMGSQEIQGSLPGQGLSVNTPTALRTGIDGAVEILRRNIQSLPAAPGSIRVLSHALPCPSPTGYSSPNIISAIHDSTPISPTVWINVFHAVPGRFNLADLPSSPPTTPGPAIGGDDYFTQKVFDSAVPVSDYHESVHALPRSPRPIVPPSSVNVSIIERYIPPTSANEFSTMFDINGSSILVDRLVELSPQNGSLIFIYPTKTGAKTFMEEHLSPILDPQLRNMVIVHNLSADLSQRLGTMPASNLLYSHETLRRKIEHLCARLSRHGSEMERYHEQQSRYTLSYASTEEVPLDKNVWAQYWWAKQEKTRVRETIQRYVHEAQARINNEQAERMGGPIALMQQLMSGIVKRTYPEGMEPKRGVEVSVFVITRTK